MSANRPPVSATVKASIEREQSVVYPVMPQSLMNEFQNRLKLNKDDADANPFDTPNTSSWKNEKPKQSPVVPRTHLATETTGILSRQAPPEAPSANAVVEKEVLQLKGIIKGCIHNRSQEQGREPLSVGELSAEIKRKTNNSWGGYWSKKHGPLAEFLKRHKDVFSIIRNKYVILAGTENEVNIPPVATAAPPKQQQQPAPGPTPNITMGVPLNVLAQQQQQQQQHHHQPYHQQSMQNPMMQYGQPQMSMNPYQQQPGYNNPNMNPFGNAPLPPQPQQQYQMNQPPLQPSWQMPQTHDPFATGFADPPPLQWNGTATAPTDPSSNFWGESSGGPSTESNPFDITFKSEAAIDDSFWRMDSKDDMNPLSVFDSDLKPASTVQENTESKLMLERQLSKQKQQEEDAAFARKLQDEEYARAQQARGSSSISSGTQETRITYTASEIREMAENEIGKDNVRIMAGFSVIKYGREGRPHQRKMWVNSSLTHLAWESGQYDGSHRGLELSKVREIRVGEMTKTIARSTKDIKKVRSLCFSLETSQRTLDLQACSIIQRDSLVAGLRKVIQFNKKHKPVRKDKYRTEVTVYTS